MRRFRSLCMAVFTLFLQVLRPLVAAEAEDGARAVVLNPDGEVPAWFAYYGIACTAFPAHRERPLDTALLPSVADALAEARLLLFERDTAGTQLLFADEACRAAMAALLARGGVLYFRYNGLPEGPAVARFFEEVGAEDPGRTAGEYHTARLEDGAASWLAAPHRLDPEPQGYGWWTRFGERAQVLARPQGVEQAAALLEYRVDGGGRIILSRLFKMDAGKTEAVENLLVSVFGRRILDEGVGEAVPLREPFAHAPEINPLLFSGLGRKPWHEPGCALRRPLLLKEPVGLERRDLCVELPLPPGADPRSVRAFTAEGFAAPFQVGGTNLLLQTGLYPHGIEAFFVYWNAEGASGEGPASGTAAGTCATLRETDAVFELANDHLRIGIDRARGAFTEFTIRGGSGNSAIAVYGRRMGTHPSNYIYDSGATAPESVQVVERGPLRVGVEFRYPDARRIVYRLAAGSHHVTEEIDWNGGALRKRMHWAPYGDTQQDHFFYRAASGIKTFRCASGPLASPAKAMVEGWYAIGDERGESVGEFFDPGRLHGLGLYGHMYGLYVHAYNRALRGSVCRKAFTAVRGSWEAVRQGYVDWRNPPAFALGGTQERTPARPVVPRHGKDSLRMYYLGPERCAGKDPRTFVEEAREMGANYLALSAYTPFWKTRFHPSGGSDFLDIVTRAAHEQGLGVYVNLVHDGRFVASITPEDDQEACMLTHRGLYLEVYRELARHDVDGISLSDEGYLAVSAEAMRREFERRTRFSYDDARAGIRGREFDISNPATAELALVRMALYNEHKRAMTEAIRAIKPDLVVTRLFSPNNHSGIASFDDLETDGEYFSCASTDLYSTDVSATRFMTQWTRALGGNQRSHAPINFPGCLWEKERLWINQQQHLFAGSCNFLHFAGGFNVAVPRTMIEVKRFYNWIDFTGLGDRMARAEPARHLGILWDREAFMASVRRGERSTGTTAPVFYERPIEALVRRPDTQADILFGRFFRQPDVADAYPVVLVPSGWALGEGILEAMERHARQGGDVIVCGLTLAQPGVGNLAGVTAGQELVRRRVQVAGADGAMAEPGPPMALERVALEPGPEASVLLVERESGAPLVTARPCGRGRVVALAAAYGYEPLMDGLCVALGRPAPFRLQADEGSPALLGNLIQGDGYRILALCNMSATSVAKGGIHLHPEPPPGAQVVDMETGAVRAWASGLRVSVAPGALAFLYVADRVALDVPSATTVIPSPDASGGRMDFLRQAPPAPREAAAAASDPGKLAVGVFRGEGRERGRAFEKGSRMILETLTGKPDLEVLALTDLSEATLSRCDVVVVPNLGHPKVPLNLNGDWIACLRRFAERGGGVLLCHHAVGAVRLGGSVFPEVGAPRGTVAIQELRAAADHPVITGQAFRERFRRFVEDPAFADEYSASFMKDGELFQASFPDYQAIEPAPGAEVAARSVYDAAMKQGDDPVLVAGSLGKGRVLLCGLAIGCRAYKNEQGDWVEEDAITAGERKILVNAAYWLQGGTTP